MLRLYVITFSNSHFSEISFGKPICYIRCWASTVFLTWNRVPFLTMKKNREIANLISFKSIESFVLCFVSLKTFVLRGLSNNTWHSRGRGCFPKCHVTFSPNLEAKFSNFDHFLCHFWVWKHTKISHRVTKCHVGEGGSKIVLKSVTYYLNGPYSRVVSSRVMTFATKNFLFISKIKTKW